MIVFARRAAPHRVPSRTAGIPRPVTYRRYTASRHVPPVYRVPSRMAGIPRPVTYRRYTASRHVPPVYRVPSRTAGIPRPVTYRWYTAACRGRAYIGRRNVHRCYSHSAYVTTSNGTSHVPASRHVAYVTMNCYNSSVLLSLRRSKCESSVRNFRVAQGSQARAQAIVVFSGFAVVPQKCALFVYTLLKNCAK